MRQVLVDMARERLAQKRGGALWLRTTFDASKLDAEQLPEQFNGGRSQVDTLALEQALAELEQIDSRKAQVVELRFFAGMEMQDLADMLAISRKTAQRDWDIARSFLYAYLSNTP